MRSLSQLVVVFAGIAGGIPGWGYLYSMSHAAININVDDYALKAENRLYGAPHGTSLLLRDASNSPLAAARAVEPLGSILANHPNIEVGDCRQYVRSASDYSTCYELYSRWSSIWAPHVRVADVIVGDCHLRSVPVDVHQSNDDWVNWWVPLPHIGGLPRRNFVFSIAIDSRACIQVSP